MKTTYRIFLASSYQLQVERTALVVEVNRLNDKLFKKQVHLELIIWEKLDAGNDPLRKQNFYNEQLKNCDILIFAYWGQLGIFTKEEYQLAQNLFVDNGLPKIYTFKKTIPVDFILNEENVKHLKALEKILYEKDKEQWPWEFKNAEGFIHKFTIDLEARFDNPNDTHFAFPNLPKAKLLSPNAVADPNVFFGREEELKEIRKRLDKSGKLMLINAEGGIGKTTLAAKYWYESLHEYKHNAWLFCENGIVNALKELAPKLNLDLSGMDETQQLKALKNALLDVHDDFLLVFDNANDDEDIRVFRQTFEGFHWHVLITSRCQGVLDKEQELPIAHLPPPLAKSLFERYYREEGVEFDELLNSILQKLSYHTLSVELFAKTLKELTERGETMKQFVEKLDSEGIFLGKRAKNINTDYTLHSRIEGGNSDEILSNFYNFTNLAKDENLRYYLVNMALLPAEEYDFVFLCDLFGQEPINFETIHSLATKGWLGKNGQKFKINPIIQEIALRNNQKTLIADSKNLLDRLNYKLQTDGYNLIHINLAEAEPYAKLIYQLNKGLEAFPSLDIGNLNFSVGIYFKNRGNIASEQYAYKKYCSVFQRLLKIHDNNLIYKNGLADSFEKLGSIYEQIGDWKNALLNYQERNRIGKEIYDRIPKNLNYKNGLAVSYSKLGGIYEQSGDWKNALMNYLQYYRISKEINDRNPENLAYKNGLAISYEKLGGIYEQIGDWKNALLNYQEYFQLIYEIYEKYPEKLNYKNGLAIAYSKLGGIYEQSGDVQASIINYKESSNIFKQIYENCPENLLYKNGLGISYEKLGDIYQQTGDWKNALLSYLERNRIGKEIYERSPENLSYKNGLAISYSKLGDIYLQTGDWENALSNYQKRNFIGKEISERSPENLLYKNGLAISFEKLGGIYEHIEDWGNALLNYQDQLRIFKEIYESNSENLNFQKGLAISYSKIGGICDHLGDWENALLNYQEQLRIFKEIYERSPENLSYKNGLAISYEKLGGINEQMKDWKNALFNYQQRNQISKEINESSPENLSYKNGLATSHLKLAGVYMANGQISNAVKDYDLCRKMFLEIVIATEGQLIDFVYNFAWTCNKLTEIVKQNALFNIIEKEQIISIRREGYKYIQPIYEAGLLQSNRVGVAEALGNMSFYDF